MTEEQIDRYNELKGAEELTPEEETELDELDTLVGQALLDGLQSDQDGEEGPAEPDPHAGLCVYDSRLLRFVSPVFRGDDAEEEALAFVEDHDGDLEVREV